MSLEKELRSAIQTGKVKVGSSSTLRGVKEGKGTLVIVANNCPSDYRQKIDSYAKLAKIPMYVFEGTSKDLGGLCKKPHSVMAMLVEDAGNSDIMNEIKGSKE